MKYILTLAALLLAGCAHQDNTPFTPPSAIEVHRNVAAIREYVKPDGKKAFSDLEASIQDYQKKVEGQSLLLAKTQEDAAYWHEKQVKALKELWWWRGIALISVALVIAYIGIKTSWRFLL